MHTDKVLSPGEARKEFSRLFPTVEDPYKDLDRTDLLLIKRLQRKGEPISNDQAQAERKAMDSSVNTLEYVDVRGADPVYIKGFVVTPLPGKSRGITLEDARIVAAKLKG